MVRLKHRYLVLQVIPADRSTHRVMTDSDIMGWIRKPFTDMYGIFGAGAVLTVMRFKYWNPDNMVGVVRVPKEWGRNVQHFFASLSELNGMQLTVRVYHMSGTIDRAQLWIGRNDNVFV